MRAPQHLLLDLAALAVLLAVGTGCQSNGGSSGNVSGGFYYGTGIYDPWYYGGHYYDDPDIIVAPPPRPERPPARPVHPIAPAPAPRPLPSVPSMPRPALRR